MMLEPLIHWLCGNPVARRIGDAFFVVHARNRLAELDKQSAAKAQEQALLRLVQQAQHTRFGKDHDFGRIRTLDDYQRRIPLRDYEAFWREYWQPAFPRLQGVTWPGPIPYFALSSGTTSGTTKYIPVSTAMLASNRKAALSALSVFVAGEPDARLFQGRSFILGGSTDLQRLDGDILAGDLSGIVAREVPAFLRPYTFPPLDLALVSDWDEKVRVLAENSAHLPITSISGVPSWLLILFNQLKQITGKDRICDIWPNLRLIMHGGVKFDPYREIFRKEFGGMNVRFLDIYGCSEGFVAFEDPRYDLLRLVSDHDIFFEFVPVEDLGNDRPTRHTVANLELGVQYALVLTTCAGLWSYVIGDTVAFERRDPPLLRFTGRTKYFLSAFGEHLINEEVETAVSNAATMTDAAVVDFHVGPLFPARPAEPGRHLYLVEFARVPADLNHFTSELDATLCRINDDYRAHRTGGTGMATPEIRPVPPGAFADWMRAHGKLGGQHKLPRMDNTGELTRRMSEWLAANHANGGVAAR
jgi:hypothetical protein